MQHSQLAPSLDSNLSLAASSFYPIQNMASEMDSYATGATITVLATVRTQFRWYLLSVLSKSGLNLRGFPEFRVFKGLCTVTTGVQYIQWQGIARFMT